MGWGKSGNPNLSSTDNSAPGPQTAGLLGGSEFEKGLCAGPRIAGEAKANPGEPCQDLGQSVLDMSLCAIAWVELLVKPKESHGLSPHLSGTASRVSQHYLRSTSSKDECPVRT